MSLIAGMDDVIAYIKKIEDENKKLKEENKNLKEDITNHPDFNEIATDWYERHVWIVDKDEYANLLTEYEDKKEEIEQLKIFSKIASIKFREQEMLLVAYRKENEKLKEENECGTCGQIFDNKNNPIDDGQGCHKCCPSDEEDEEQ